MNEETVDENAFGGLYKFGMLVVCAAGVALYVKMLRNRANWVKMEALLGVLYAVGIFLARVALSSYLKTDVDRHSILFFQMVKISTAMHGLVVYLTRNAVDPSVHITVSVFGILMRVSILLCDLHGLLHVEAINNAPVQTDIGILILLLIGNLFHLAKNLTKFHLTIGNPFRWQLYFDGVVTFLLGLSFFGFSKMAFQMLFPKTDVQPHHLILFKEWGCSLASGAFLSFWALTFKSRQESSVILKSKSLAHLATAILGVYHLMSDKSFKSSTFSLFLLLVCVLAFNAFLPVWKERGKKRQE